MQTGVWITISIMKIPVSGILWSILENINYHMTTLSTSDVI